MSSKLTLFVIKLELEREGKDDLLNGLKEGVIVVDRDTHEVVYSNTATRNANFEDDHNLNHSMTGEEM